MTEKSKKEGLEREPLKTESNDLNTIENRSDDRTSPIYTKPIYKNCYKHI
jgi:hypothetical protein